MTLTPPKWMDGYLRTNLERARELVAKDWDLIFLVDGGERTGKSVLAQQAAYILDPELDISRICFTPHEFRRAVLDAEPRTAVIYDEAYTGLQSRGTMSIINRTLVSLLAEIGQKNLIIFVVMPTFFDLDKYVALWRSRALLHVYHGQEFERGYFGFYNIDRKKLLYIDGKKYYDYTKVKPNFYGKFPDGYVVDDKAYRRKKLDSMSGRAKEQEEVQRRKEVEAELLDRILSIGESVTHKVKMQMLGMSAATYYRRLSEWKEQNEGFAGQEVPPNETATEETDEASP